MESLPDEKVKAPKQRKKKDVGSRLKLRSIAIQKFLLDQTTGSERSVRKACGDTPDTSKALRMLVKEHKVRRFGSGGRSNPFVYMALIPPSIRELELLNQAHAMETNDSIAE